MFSRSIRSSVQPYLNGATIGIETARGQPAEDLPRALETARAA